MIIDTTDAFAMIASWDRWKGNGYAHLNYPNVSVSSASHMLGQTLRPGDYKAVSITDEEGQRIDAALAAVGKISPHMLNVTVAYVRADGSCLAVEKATGVNRKAVGPLANAGLEVCGDAIRKALGWTD